MARSYAQARKKKKKKIASEQSSTSPKNREETKDVKKPTSADSVTTTTKDAPTKEKNENPATTTTLPSNGSNEKKQKKKKKKNKNKKKKSLSAPPKPGEEGYKTPTQLRNARKRRAKKRKRGNNDNDGSKNNDNATTVTIDPSMKYIVHPKAAPIVQHARKYFSNRNITPFQIHLGPIAQWRSVSKLAVRPDPSNQNKTVIGLFLPNSHTVLPIPDCRAHYPSINTAVEAVRRACDKVGVKAYDEESGEGYLRYLALGVERTSGKVQLTLVWNSEPYHDDDEKKEEWKKGLGNDLLPYNDSDDEDENCNDEGKTILKKLCNELLRVGKDSDGAEENVEPPKRKRRRGRKGAKIQDEANGNQGDSTPSVQQQRLVLHSLWVHHNAAWKHSNAIFDCSGGDDSETTSSSSTWKHIYGPKAIIETLNLSTKKSTAPPPPSTVPLQFPPNVFRQANIDAFASIVSRIRDRIYQHTQEKRKKNDVDNLPSCIELYGGVGTIGLNICDLTSTFVSSDENPYNEECFHKSVSKLKENKTLENRSVEYIPKNASNMVQQEAFSDDTKNEVIIVDPPRKGLDDVVRNALTNVEVGGGPQLLVYVSCGFHAFERDCNAFLESGRWKLDHAEGHLLFPGSDAIETLAFFVRNKK